MHIPTDQTVANRSDESSSIPSTIISVRDNTLNIRFPTFPSHHRHPYLWITFVSQCKSNVEVYITWTYEENLRTKCVLQNDYAMVSTVQSPCSSTCRYIGSTKTVLTMHDLTCTATSGSTEAVPAPCMIFISAR